MKVERKQLLVKLWVIKYCLKIIYPKYNLYTFLVFLAIKFRVQNLKKLRKKSVMDTYKIKIVPEHIQLLLIKDYLDDNILVQLPKCLIISKEQYIQLCSENLFYVDNGVLWVMLKLSSETIQDYKKKNNSGTSKNNELKYSFSIVTSELHKKLWAKESASNMENARIVPIIGSKYLGDNVCVVTENEFYNLTNTFDIINCDDINITLHPVPSLTNAPRIAEVAEVNLIVNDFDLSNDFLKEVLSNYFEIPKVLSENDVISISLSSEMTLKYQYKYLDVIESAGKIHFKIKKLTSNENQSIECDLIPSMKGVQKAYFIVKGVTQLTLGENIHLLRPNDKYFNKGGSKAMHIDSLCPTGLKQKFDQMQETIKAFLNGELDILATSLSSPILPLILLTGAVGSGKHLLVKTLAKFNGLSCIQIDCNALQSSTAKQTESKISAMIQKAKSAAPTIILLDNFEVFAVDPENNEDCRIMEYFINTITDLYENYTKHPIIFIAVTTASELKPNILRIFLEKYHIPKLNSHQRYEMLQWMSSVMQLNIDGDSLIPLNKHNFSVQLEDSHINEHSKEVLHRVAAKCETFVYGDIDTLVHFALRESYLKQNQNAEMLSSEPNMRFVEEENFVTALESMRSLQSQHLDAPKIPKVYWEDIGGLEKLKKELMKTIELPIKYPHLFKNSTLKRSGILLYGPPGCGKTLVAKAVSTELNVSFLSVKGPELLNMYIGQSEENVRKVFESARASSPCIVFLDELDALAPRRGAAGDSGGASDRVVSQLLAEVDGVASEDADTNNFVFIMGATNRPDLLEQSLLRPGRLDKLIYVGPYSGLEEKTSVLKALCRKYRLRPELNLADVAEALPDRCTGADLMQVVSTARAAAVRDLVNKLKSGALKETELSSDAVILGISELWQGVESFRPSVNDKDLAYYESLQSKI